METYVTSKIGGVQYRIESDSFVSARFAMITSESEINWVGLRITNGCKIVIERWNNNEDADREYIVDDKEEENKVQSAIGHCRTLLAKIKQLQRDEQQSELVGVDLDDLDYDVMMIVGNVFAEMSNADLPESVEAALKL